jgi:hypothetical protein
MSECVDNAFLPLNQHQPLTISRLYIFKISVSTTTTTTTMAPGMGGDRAARCQRRCQRGGTLSCAPHGGPAARACR